MPNPIRLAPSPWAGADGQGSLPSVRARGHALPTHLTPAYPFPQFPKPQEQQSMDAEERETPQPGPPAAATLRVAAAELRWCYDEAWLPCASTDEVEPLTGVVGQDDAIE